MKTIRISKDDLNFLVNKIRYGILPKHTDYDEIIAEITDLFSVEDINLSNTENIGKNLKPFDIEEAKAGKPVCTRDGKKTRIICFDRKSDASIAALIMDNNGREEIHSYYEDGKSVRNQEYSDDLMMLSEKKEGWVNVYHGFSEYSEHVSDIVFNTKEEAIQYAENEPSYITTVKIEWEE